MRKLLGVVVGLLLCGIAGGSGVTAQDNPPFRLDPAAFDLTLTKLQDTASFTFQVVADESVDSISFQMSLFEADAGNPDDGPQQPGQVTFSPETLEDLIVGQPYLVEINITDAEAAGTWTGTVNARWVADEEQGREEKTLTVHVATEPSLQMEKWEKIVIQSDRFWPWFLRGDSEITRHIVLREMGGSTAVTGVTTQPFDLTTSDQSQVFSRDDIHATLNNVDNTIGGGGFGELTLSFDMSHAASGEYTGDLIVHSANAPDLTIPLEVTVKDPGFWPLFFLVIGIITGLGLTVYRTSTLPRNKLRVRIADTKELVKDDAEFEQHCGLKVNAEIEQVEIILRQEEGDFNTANTHMETVEALVRNWRHYRATLVDSIHALANLQTAIDDFSTQHDAFGQIKAAIKLRDEIDLLQQRRIPDFVDKPQDLRDAVLDDQTGYQARYNGLKALFLKQERFSKWLADAAVASNPASGVVLDSQTLEAHVATLKELRTQLAQLPAITTISDLAAIDTKTQSLIDTAESDADQAHTRWKIYTTADEETRGLLTPQINSDTIGAVATHIQDTMLAQAAAYSNDHEWAEAERLAVNCWLAAQSVTMLIEADEMCPGEGSNVDWTPVTQAEMVVAKWLTDSAHYADPTDTFKQKLRAELNPFRDAVETALDKLFPLNWEPVESLERRAVSRSRDIGAAATPMYWSLAGDREHDAHVTNPDITEPPRYNILDREWWTPRRSIFVFHVITLVIGVGFLAVAGYSELYESDADFGSGGFMDYFTVFLWGFGIEAVRSQIVGLVRGWGIKTPRET